jgi:hypothetical protein
MRDTHSEGFSYFVTSIAAPVASGWSVRRVGLSPTGKRRLATAHTLNRRKQMHFAAVHRVCLVARRLRGRSWEARSKRICRASV